jgi:hypothetical protein
VSFDDGTVLMDSHKFSAQVVRLQPDQLNALDSWIAKQDASLTRPEAIRAMMETILHILSKDTGEKPAKKAKIR